MRSTGQQLNSLIQQGAELLIRCAYLEFSRDSQIPKPRELISSCSTKSIPALREALILWENISHSLKEKGRKRSKDVFSPYADS
jgi:hypothetical protein